MSGSEPIAPIPSGLLPTGPLGRAPVERPGRVARERDRPPKEENAQHKRERLQESVAEDEWPSDEEGPRHIDVRV